jgi:hypothetical protein
MKISLRVLLIATTAALLAPVGAGAQAPADLPVGEAHGVRLVRDHGSLVLIFSQRAAKLRERFNSPYAWMECTKLGEVFSTSSGGNLDVPATGRRFSTGIGTRRADFCDFFLRSHTVQRNGNRIHFPRRELVSIPLTQKGAVYVDERTRAAKMYGVLGLAFVIKVDQHLPGYPTGAQLFKKFPKLAKVVVELAAPTDSPPPKRIGYYSDGLEHIAVVMLSASGERLFLELSAGDVLSTNVAAYLPGIGR